MPDSIERTILVVDDDEGHAELVRRNLRRSGVTTPIIALDSGQAVLDYVFAMSAHELRRKAEHLLILLDMKMPGPYDGVDVLQKLKADPIKKRIPVIMLTTTDDPREIDRCYDLGCNIYIVKPVDSADFTQTINQLGLFLSVMSIPSEQRRAS